MAGPSIGGVSLSFVHGLPAKKKPRVDDWVTPGIDGVGAQLLGNGDADFELTTVLYCMNNAAANAHLVACRALQGTQVSLVDDWGDTYASLLAKHVDDSGPGVKRPCMAAIGGAWYTAAVRVELRWKMAGNA